ncbi:hypothetical protein FOA52_003648 [Chlamydomonas sp. UWO 241]|nr:hypothetical protein FOA52_003648 [Chlamydomonas sp. UWO 241]
MVDGVVVGTLDDAGVSQWDGAYEASISAEEKQSLLRLTRNTDSSLQSKFKSKEVYRASPGLFIISSSPTSLLVRCASSAVGDRVQALLDRAAQAEAEGGQPSTSGGGCGCASDRGPTKQTQQQQQQQPHQQQQRQATNSFDEKTEKASSEMYFSYYGALMHQQNMLQDFTRTGTYYAAIVQNPADFEGRSVMDVGAGSGILSLFAAQAGARKVYAVEASGMARFARQLADSNPTLGGRLEVVNAKVEEAHGLIPEKVDVLISEPMGTLLVNERMLETYLYARDHFLKPGGAMFPQVGRIHAAAFSDDVLYNEVLSKSFFWMQPNFYGVDITSLQADAMDSYFAQVVVDAFKPSTLVSSCATKVLDFLTVSESELHDISIPLSLKVGGTGPVTVHGVASWFDVFFNGSNNQVWLSTAPGLPTTHWFQLRCVLKGPLYVNAPCTLSGTLRLVAHARQSYHVHVELNGPPLQPGGPPQSSGGVFDLKEPYYRQCNPFAWQAEGGQ